MKRGGGGGGEGGEGQPVTLRTDQAGNEGGCVHGVTFWENALPKLQALVFDIFPPATAITDYAIGV